MLCLDRLSISHLHALSGILSIKKLYTCMSNVEKSLLSKIHKQHALNVLQYCIPSKYRYLEAFAGIAHCQTTFLGKRLVLFYIGANFFFAIYKLQSLIVRRKFLLL